MAISRRDYATAKLLRIILGLDKVSEIPYMNPRVFQLLRKVSNDLREIHELLTENPEDEMVQPERPKPPRVMSRYLWGREDV
jgi:hypothetical protein